MHDSQETVASEHSFLCFPLMGIECWSLVEICLFPEGEIPFIE